MRTARLSESAGPITWGFRLESAGSAEAWRAITYDKGAWIFHMLRRRMGDAQFLKMLAELRRRFESRRLSTAGLRELVKEYLPPQLKPAKIDAFFDNWVYSMRNSHAEAAALYRKRRRTVGEDFGTIGAERSGRRLLGGGPSGDSIRQRSYADDLGGDLQQRRQLLRDAEAGPAESVDSRGHGSPGVEEVNMT